MRRTLRFRLLIYGAAGAGYLLILLASLAVVAVPAVETVDRSLAPFGSVFVAIAERNRQVLGQIDALERFLAGSAAVGPALDRPTPSRAVSPLLARYSGVLPARASQELALTEDAVAWIEAAIGEAVALKEVGDLESARLKLTGIREARVTVERHGARTMVLAMETGREARDAFRASMTTLIWLVVAWLLLGGVVWGGIAYDAGRHIFAPVQRLEARARRIAEGDWSEPSPRQSAGALDALASQFNVMTETLRERAGRHAHMATAGELLAGMAHELNNPLQAIRGIAELERGRSGAQAQDWAVVQDQAHRASKLVNDLIRFVRPPQRRVARVGLNDLVRDALDLIGFQYRADGVAVDQELDEDLPPVQADANDLVQVLVNLLGNAHGALQQAPGERRVVVRTWADGDRVGVTVHDSGPGVPEDVRERVFNPFFSTKTRGFGLGLSVARDILRGYGGDVQLEPAASGAAFSFWLPASTWQGAPPTSTGGGTTVGRLAGRQILVVDDEDAVRSVLARSLEREGATVRTAAGGIAALASIGQRRPDAVLLDVRMPDLDGLSVYRRIQETDPTLARHVLFVTGDPTAMDPGLEISRRRILSKPVELAGMLEALRRILAA